MFKEREEECEQQRTHPLLPASVSLDSGTATRAALISNIPLALLLPSKAQAYTEGIQACSCLKAFALAILCLDGSS